MAKLNFRLWAYLPPGLLEEPTDWQKHWQEALRDVDVSTLRFIVEQGYEFMTPGDWMRLWEKSLHDSNVTALQFLVERGFDTASVMRRADWKQMWFKAAADWRMDVMAFMLEQGFDVNTLDKHGKSALFSVLANHGGRLEPVELLVEAGIGLESVEELIQYGDAGVDDKAGAGEAAAIARYLRRVVKERM